MKQLQQCYIILKKVIRMQWISSYQYDDLAGAAGWAIAAGWAGWAGSAGAIDFAVFVCFCLFLFLLPFGLPYTAASQ
jgi:hypothetical protein